MESLSTGRESPSDTASSSRHQDEEGENSIIVVAGANRSVTANLLNEHEDLIRNAAIVLTQLEIPLRAVCAFADHPPQCTARTRSRARPSPFPILFSAP